MDIKQLKYFYTIVEEGQITGAAKKLHIAQPPLTYQLKTLEEELGTKLIERGSRSRNLELTDAGKMLYRRAKQILMLAETAENEVRELKKGLCGILTIGTTSSSGAHILNNRLIEFHKKYPMIHFEICEGNTYEVLELLNKGIIEIAFIRTPFSAIGLHSVYLPKESMIAVMREEFNWTKEKKIDILDLKDKPLIFYKRYRDLIYKACIDSNFEPEVFCLNEDARTSLLWADKGLGIAVVPKSSMELIGSSSLIYKSIQSELLTTRIAIVWSENTQLSSAGKNLLSIFSN